MVRALCIGAFSGLLWALYQLRVRQLRRKFAWWLKRESTSAHVSLASLHDTVLQSLHGLLMSFSTGRQPFA